jgi:hypothetical protein
MNVLKFPHAVWQSFLSIFPISQVEQWLQAKRAATYQAKCLTRLLSAPTELESMDRAIHSHFCCITP